MDGEQATDIADQAQSANESVQGAIDNLKGSSVPSDLVLEEGSETQLVNNEEDTNSVVHQEQAVDTNCETDEGLGAEVQPDSNSPAEQEGQVSDSLAEAANSVEEAQQANTESEIHVNNGNVDAARSGQIIHSGNNVLESAEHKETENAATTNLQPGATPADGAVLSAEQPAPWDEYKPKSPAKPSATESSSPLQSPSNKPSAEPSTSGAANQPELLSPVAAASAMTQGPGTSTQEPAASVYHIKWVTFKTKQLPIVTQNENGPCPLIAIMNVLFLNEKIKVPAVMQMVTSDQLMEYLGDYIFEHVPKEITDDARLNYEQNMHDAMAVFHKLQTGLDVNVKFTGVGHFEYTSECIVFDLLHIPLYHGWLVDPQDETTVLAVGNHSYNQLVEKIIGQKTSDRHDLVTEALAAEAFLESSMSQLTYHGLSELQQTVKEQEMCVFFRNNHFSTIYKNKNELFLLVTDQGFLTESNVVWETLSNVEGDGHFVDADFRTYKRAEPSTAPIELPSVSPGSEEQVDQDYLVALSLEQEQRSRTQPTTSWQDTGLSDHDLAMQLQEEENRMAAVAQQQQQQRVAAAQAQQPVPPRAPLGGRGQPPETDSAGAQKKKECVIL